MNIFQLCDTSILVYVSVLATIYFQVLLLVLLSLLFSSFDVLIQRPGDPLKRSTKYSAWNTYALLPAGVTIQPN